MSLSLLYNTCFIHFTVYELVTVVIIKSFGKIMILLNY